MLLLNSVFGHSAFNRRLLRSVRSQRHDADGSQDKWWLSFQVEVARIENVFLPRMLCRLIFYT